jgi:hypothetical protein
MKPRRANEDCGCRTLLYNVRTQVAMVSRAGHDQRAESLGLEWIFPTFNGTIRLTEGISTLDMRTVSRFRGEPLERSDR